MDPNVDDLSNSDCVRYRVTRGGQSIITGLFVGSGIGECSSDEEKFKWRKPVCDEEYNETPEDRRREVWKKVDGKAVKLKQVRMAPADIANTVLKMADKRAYVALALQATAASDIFTQDIEDLPEDALPEAGKANAPIQPPKEKAPTAPATPPTATATPPTDNVDPALLISEAQGKRLYAIWKGAGKKDADVMAHLHDHYGVKNTKQIKKADYEAICDWAGAGDAQ